jgi:3D-(3,5/4)-trihydroxycyclohexane-1,2-dione acylhydrolase (decyclizing)
VICAEADVVIGVGTRLQDFTTGSRALVPGQGQRLLSLNVQAYDAMKHGAEPLCADARAALDALSQRLGGQVFDAPDAGLKADWFARVDPLTAAPQDGNALPSDMQVIGAVQRAAGPDTVVMSPPVRCRASCTSSGRPAGRCRITWNTAFPAWATRSPGRSASRWPNPTAT